MGDGESPEVLCPENAAVNLVHCHRNPDYAFLAQLAFWQKYLLDE